MAAFVVFRLRRRAPQAQRSARLPGGRPAVLGLTILFGVLALVASVSVGPRITPVPLLILATAAAVITVYVFTYVPRLERREAAELAGGPRCGRPAGGGERRPRAGRHRGYPTHGLCSPRVCPGGV